MKNTELKQLIEQQYHDIMNKPLFIFDFDDTLITDEAVVYVVDKQGNKRALSVQEYHYYHAGPDEHIDVAEFDEVTNPVIKTKYMNLLKKHMPNVAILTARTNAKPVRQFMNSLGINVPDVAAIGVHHPETNTTMINAKRKQAWVDNVISERDLTYVEFWDDNPHNVKMVQELETKHPGVMIVTHLVID